MSLLGGKIITTKNKPDSNQSSKEKYLRLLSFTINIKLLSTHLLASGIVPLITQHPLRKIQAAPGSCSSHTVLLISPFVNADLPTPDGWSGLRVQHKIREQSKANWPCKELNL